MGIRPWEHDLMTVEQMDQAIADCASFRREQKRLAMLEV